MSAVAFIRRCLDAGMALEIALLAAEQFEAEIELAVLQDGAPATGKSARNARAYQKRAAAKATEKRLKSDLIQNPNKATESDLIATETTEIQSPLAGVVTKPLRIITTEDTQEDKSSFVGPPTKKNPPPATLGTRLSEAWEPDADDRLFALQENLNPSEIDREAAKFRDHFRSSPGRGAAKLSWPATWRNWVRRASDDKRKELARRPQPGGYGSSVEDMASINARRQRERENGDPIPDRGRLLLGASRL